MSTCEYPKAPCTAQGTVQIKHDRTDEDGEVVETAVVGVLCMPHALELLFPKRKPSQSDPVEESP